jgi:hypothetical protein
MPEARSAGEDHLREWSGRTLIDRNGERIGEVDFLYVDSESDRPEWAGVLNLHLLGMRPALVPLRRATVRGREVRVGNVTKEQVRGAPYVEPERGLSDEDEQLLVGYYRLHPRMTRRPAPPKPPAGPRRRPRSPEGLSDSGESFRDG